MHAVLLLAALAGSAIPPASEPPGIKVRFNQDVIDGLRTELDLSDTRAVFDLVFSQLADTIRIYPTENYYYFDFAANGKMIWGNLRLSAIDRDRGVLHLGYFLYDENGRSQDRSGYSRELTAEDGVAIEKQGPFDYVVSYRGKTVRFLLNDVGMTPPRTAKLRESEAFVGPVFDESGLSFFLLFDRKEKHFFYVLNEDRQVPEELDRLNESVLIGRRTGFAFFDDRKHQRKVLVAVGRHNTGRNNYYDGPFDQLPDNYVEQTQIQTYMEEAYPETKDLIDRFGNYLNQAGRLVIMPYSQYSSDRELEFVATCKKGNSESAFLACITPDFQQLSSCRGKNCSGTASRAIGKAKLKVEIPADPPAAAKPPER